MISIALSQATGSRSTLSNKGIKIRVHPRPISQWRDTDEIIEQVALASGDPLRDPRVRRLQKSNANGSATTKTAINIGTGWNTGLSITSNSSTNGDSALNIGYTSANSGTPTQAAIDLTLTNNNISAGNTLYGQRITNAGSAVSVTTALLDLNNANPNASSVTNGIIFNNSGGTAASYDNGINFTPVTSFTNGAIISKITGGN